MEPTRLELIAGILAGLAASLAIATVWHLLGLTSPAAQEGYPFTEYFTRCISWPFVGVFALVGFALGWMSARAWAIAIGMMLPLPLATVIEVILDPTSHNLLPLEAILYWMPAFGVAFAGAYCSRRVRRRVAGAAT